MSDPGPGRHFMSLGGGFPVPPKKLTHASPFPLSNLSNSFVAHPPPSSTPISTLPDIYTTCPELRKFNPIFKLGAVDDPPPAPRPPPMKTPTPFVAVPRFPYPLQTPFFQMFDPNALIIRPFFSRPVYKRRHLPTNSSHELGFVPRSEWPPQVFTLWDLRQMYFTRRNGPGRRFDFKLYNALCITKVFPAAYYFIGAIWITQTVMKIHSQTFAQLLGIHAVQGGLFHKQGNFSRHGFLQVMKQAQLAQGITLDLADVDDYLVRLFTDQHNRFSRDSEFVITETMPIVKDDDDSQGGSE